jgi:thiol-disulfide isomerase/thioredoxin
MERTRSRRAAATVLIALIVGVVGGWALSRSSDDVDAKLTNPGVVQDPTISTNANTAGQTFGFAALTSLPGGGETTPTLAGRPTVVNFWFSTCEPCRREMPELAAAAARWAGKVDFVGINPNDTEESATAFLSKNRVTYQNYLDRSGDQLLLSKVGTMPTTFFLDSAGTIVTMHAGELTAQDIEDNIAGILPKG